GPPLLEYSAIAVPAPVRYCVLGDTTEQQRRAEIDLRGNTMEDLKVTAGGYDFKPAQAAMQRYVDKNLLSGISWAVMVGRDLVDVNCVGWADKEAQTPLR